VNILIIEDNRHMRRMLSEMLGSALAPHAVHEAADAHSALILCRDLAPELVLMDVDLPDANGIALTTTIKTLDPGASVVILSSHRNQVYQDAARAMGATAYVFKDEIHARLLPLLAALLADRPDNI
jgi:DNA-binding NarL/FixJ family response regulator